MLACQHNTHPVHVVDAVGRFADQNKRVAVVCESWDFLSRVRHKAGKRGIPCQELHRVEDRDLWNAQSSSRSGGVLVIARLEAVKGYEFDVVFACDLSYGVIPRLGTPPEEYGREAAILYTALTRARDLLVMTHVGKRSVFLDAMSEYVDFYDGSISDAWVRALSCND